MYDVQHPRSARSMLSLTYQSNLPVSLGLPSRPSVLTSNVAGFPPPSLFQSVIPLLRRGSSGIHLIKGAKSKKRAAASVPPIHLAGWLAPSKAT